MALRSFLDCHGNGYQGNQTKVVVLFLLSGSEGPPSCKISLSSGYKHQRLDYVIDTPSIISMIHFYLFFRSLLWVTRLLCVSALQELRTVSPLAPRPSLLMLVPPWSDRISLRHGYQRMWSELRALSEWRILSKYIRKLQVRKDWEKLKNTYMTKHANSLWVSRKNGCYSVTCISRHYPFFGDTRHVITDFLRISRNLPLISMHSVTIIKGINPNLYKIESQISISARKYPEHVQIDLSQVLLSNKAGFDSISCNLITSHE